MTSRPSWAYASSIASADNGRLVAPEDPAVLYALAADPATRLSHGAAARARVAAGWDLEAAVDRLLALFEPALADAMSTPSATALRS